MIDLRATAALSHLVHLVVVSLQGCPLGLGVFVGDGGLAQGLTRVLVLVQVDAGLLAVPVHLDLANRGEVLDQLRHLGKMYTNERQARITVCIDEDYKSIDR